MKDTLTILTTDPSLNDLGWAVVTLNRVSPNTTFKKGGEPYYVPPTIPVIKRECGIDPGQWVIDTGQWQWGLIKPEGLNINAKLYDIFFKLEHECPTPDIYVSEWPQFFDQASGQAAAMKGYTNNLAAISAYIMGRYNLPCNQVKLLTPNQWKGSQSKSLTFRKFLMIFGENYAHLNHNIIDAIMILYTFGNMSGLFPNPTPANPAKRYKPGMAYINQ